MYCQKCGAKLTENANFCHKCGCATDEQIESQKQKFSKPKTGIGVLLALFLSSIGLLIGLILYPDETVARKTFLKAWTITFIIVSVIVWTLLIILIAVIIYRYTHLEFSSTIIFEKLPSPYDRFFV